MSPVVFSVISFVVVIGLVALSRWMIRVSRAAAEARAAALEHLAAEMGTTRDPSTPDRLSGTLDGRSCALWEMSVRGSDSSNFSVRFQVALTSSTTLELYGQTSTFGAGLVNDVVIGDPEFDRWFIVRTNDVAAVATALTPEIRQQLIDWLRNGWVARLWTKDGHLWIDGGFGLMKRKHVEQTAEVLRTAVAIAKGLDRTSGPG